MRIVASSSLVRHAAGCMLILAKMCQFDCCGQSIKKLSPVMFCERWVFDGEDKVPRCGDAVEEWGFAHKEEDAAASET